MPVGEGKLYIMDRHWYALKVYYNRLQPLIEDCKEAGLEFFAPATVTKSLLFLHSEESETLKFVVSKRGKVWLYTQPGSRQPAVIPDREMDVFRFVVTAGHDGLQLLGDDKPEYHVGERVVVTGGPFKGAEGHIKRIKRDRRLIVSINGVVAVATAYIHPSLLKKVTE